MSFLLKITAKLAKNRVSATYAPCLNLLLIPKRSPKSRFFRSPPHKLLSADSIYIICGWRVINAKVYIQTQRPQSRKGHSPGSCAFESFAAFAFKKPSVSVPLFTNIENQHLTINLRVFASLRLYNHLIPALMLVSDCERIAAFLFNLETQ